MAGHKRASSADISMGFTLEAFNLLLVVQASQATVGGTVRDEESGRPLPGAVVSLPDLSRAVAADGAGRYVLRHVPPGPQHITVRYVGYAPRGLHALVPPAGPLEINVFLKAQPVRLRTIEVRSAVPVTGLEVREEGDLSDRSSSIAAVRNNPMLAEPDVLQALEGGPVVLQPESPNGVHIRGGASDQTGYLLDGIPVFSPYHAAGQFSAWNPDALSAVYLFSSAPLQEYPGALSGTIAATTKVPGERLGVQGSVSTAQARLTVDGQLGGTGVGYLWSARSRVPGIPAKRHDASYLRAESGDMMAKLELPAFAGRLRLLAYDSGNEIEAAARAEGSSPQARPNEFEWDSRSFGAEWSRNLTGTEVKVTGWSASGDAGAVWAGSDGRTTLSSARHDFGLVGTVELGAPGARTLAGVRLHRSRTAYRAEPDSAALWSLRANTPSAAAFARHTRGLDRRSSLTLGAMLATTGAGLHLGPSAQIRWKPVERWTLSASYARVHQFAQSLRNPQSVVGNVFPMDLYIGSGAPGVPAARSDQAVLMAEYLPFTGGRVALEAYT
ncbi:MAG: carboxypeptidase regulatory-like domain-containing protein, partial [Gemmatimonadales bacterium]|nr:carboxypeptidase regulatory-like domain-containing protein [Gemmatimonadales bacterium]